jgi:prefoldin subunit 5
MDVDINALISTAISAIVSAGGAGLCIYFIKDLFDGYKTFKKEVRDDIKELRTDMKKAVSDLGSRADLLNHKAEQISRTQVENQAEHRVTMHTAEVQAARVEKSLENIEKSSEKFVGVLKALFIRQKASEEEIRTLKIKVDEHHTFIKTKKESS